MEVPKRRQSIHADKKSGEERKEVARQCDSCKKHILVDSENGKETTLNEEDLKKWQELNEKKTGIYPNLDKDAPFTCCLCEPNTGKKHWLHSNVKMRKHAISTFVVFLGVIICYIFLKNAKEDEGTPFDVKIYDQTKAQETFDDELFGLENTYTKQLESVWINLASGIKSIEKTKPNRPSTFLMLYDTHSAGCTAKCIAQDVSKLAIKFLMGRTLKPLIISGVDLDDKRLLADPGLLLVDYNNTIRERGALVMMNLQDVPPEVATSLHFFCDSYSPLIEKAVYFFTLQVDQLPHFKNIKKEAENRLRELWKEKMRENFLQPLITRMTTNVLKISSDAANC